MNCRPGAEGAMVGYLPRIDVEHFEQVLSPDRREADLAIRVRGRLDLSLHAGALEPLDAPLLPLTLLNGRLEHRQAEQVSRVLVVQVNELSGDVDVRARHEAGARHRVWRDAGTSNRHELRILG